MSPSPRRKNHFRPLLTAAALLLAAAAAAGIARASDPPPAAGPPRLVTLFPRQAPVEAPAGRLARLVLPPEVLAACRSDLADLRIFDAAGREVPFLVDGLGPRDERFQQIRLFRPPLLAADRGRTDRETGPPVWRESYELEAPPAPQPGAAWVLVAETAAPRFVKRVTVTAAGSSGGDGPPIAEGSLFRLDAERQRTTLELPQLDAARLAVTLEGEDGGYLAPELFFRAVRSLPERETAEVPMTALAAPAGRPAGERGRTVVELERPRGLVPGALRLATATHAFSRRIEVWDEGPGAGDRPLGREVLYRVPGETTIEDLEIPLEPAGGDRLRVVVDDGDSPPLAGLAFAAVVRSPALVFTLPEPAAVAGDGDGEATLRFGGGRAFRPRYDLAELAPTAPTRGTGAAVWLELYDPSRLAAARLGEVEANPAYDPRPALAFAQRPGSEIDRGRFAWRRTLTARPSPEGLVRVRLDPADLAHARSDLADLRVVDGDSRQWAYLVESDAAETTVPLAVDGPRRDGRRSRYVLTPQVPPVAAERLVIEPAEPFFDRAYELVGSLDRDTAALRQGRLVRRPDDPRPVTIDLPRGRFDAFELRVEDGDDAPLTLDAAHARLALPELYFAAPAGEYALLLGDPDAAPPRYELERVRGVVLAVAAGEAETGELIGNPARGVFSGLGGRAGQQLLLWVVIAVAVVALTLLTLRLARKEEEPPRAEP